MRERASKRIKGGGFVRETDWLPRRTTGYPFLGMLFTGFVLTSTGPKVLEYNVRFGDPETEALVLLAQADLAEIMLACTERRLDSVKLDVVEGRHAVSVILASEGYPGSYPNGRKIEFGDVPEGEFASRRGCMCSGGGL